MAERHMSDEPTVWRFKQGEKVRVKFETPKAIVDGDGRRKYVEGTDVRWKTGTVSGQKRVGKMTVKDGRKERGFLYSYSLIMDESKAVVQWVDEDRLEKAK